MDSIVGFLQSVDCVGRKHPDLDPGPSFQPSARIPICRPGKTGAKKGGGEFVHHHPDGVATGSTQKPDRGPDHATTGIGEWLAFRGHQGARVVFPLSGSSFESFAKFIQTQTGKHTEVGFGEICD